MGHGYLHSDERQFYFGDELVAVQTIPQHEWGYYGI